MTISSDFTFVHKWVIPLAFMLFFAFLTVFGGYRYFSAGGHADPGLIGAPLCFLVMFSGFFLMYSCSILDEVVDAGDSLTIRRGSTFDYIDLSRILRIHCYRGRYSTMAYVRLRTSCKFGEVVKFKPCYGIDAIVDDLTRRSELAWKARAARMAASARAASPHEPEPAA